MESELLEAPAALERVAALLNSLGGGAFFSPPPVQQALARSSRIVWLACGSSHHASLLGRYALAAWAQRPSDALLGHDVAPVAPACFAGQPLCIAMSQSGETHDTLEALALAQAAGCPTLAVANVAGSALLARAHYALALPAGLERSVPATKSFLAQAYAALWLAGALGPGPLAAQWAAVPAALAPHVASLSAGGASEGAVKTASQWLSRARQAVLVGAGPASAAAHEGALKFREAAYLPAQSFALGEIKHGPMAMLEAETDVLVALVGPDDAAAAEKNLQRLLAVGLPIILIAPAGHRLVERLAANCRQAVCLPTPAAHCLMWPLFAVASLQRVSLEVALRRGAPVDAPRYLTKQISQQ